MVISTSMSTSINSSKPGMFQMPDGKSLGFTFALVSSLFLLWGFCNGMIDTMDKHFQDFLRSDKKLKPQRLSNPRNLLVSTTSLVNINSKLDRMNDFFFFRLYSCSKQLKLLHFLRGFLGDLERKLLGSLVI